jgi:hypothetical protein
MQNAETHNVPFSFSEKTENKNLKEHHLDTQLDQENLRTWEKQDPNRHNNKKGSLKTTEME